MVNPSSPHLHTNFVDGKNTPREMILSAIEAGFYSLGFSEHSCQRFDRICGMSPESEAVYKKTIASLSREFEGRLIIALGIELDEYAFCERSDYTYVIGSKHYITSDDFSDFFAVDSDVETVISGCERFFKGDWFALCDRYFQELADYIVSYKPEILGHFDLVCKLNEKNGFFDEADGHYLSSGFAALEKIAAAKPLMEINTGAIARGYKTVPYPAPAFLKRWRELGGEIVLSTDCHDAGKIDYALDDARRLALGAGYDKAWRICSREGEFEPYLL